MTGEDPLSLDRIRSVLVRLEDTIIFSLIERAQFTHSPRMYQKGAFKELTDIDFTGTWLDWFLKETEIFHGEIIRFYFQRSSTILAITFQQKLVVTQGERTSPFHISIDKQNHFLAQMNILSPTICLNLSCHVYSSLQFFIQIRSMPIHPFSPSIHVQSFLA